MAAVKKIPVTKPVEPIIPPKIYGMKTSHLNNSTNMVFRENGRNVCPWCSREHWLMGRVTAECANCGYAIPLQNTAISGGTITSQDRHIPSPSQGNYVNLGKETR